MHQGGHLATTKVIGIRSKPVMAEFQGFIPYILTDALIRKYLENLNEVKVKQTKKKMLISVLL
jgi:hypothetical protein